MQLNIHQVMQTSGVQFGTSGVRGRVVDMTDQVCWVYVVAFLQYLQSQDLASSDNRVGIAGDLRSSTGRIMAVAAEACRYLGFEPVNYGHIPSPAIALQGIETAIPTIMVTGSHIPDDRNGIKFNLPSGEILKQDEQGILAQQLKLPEGMFNAQGTLVNLTALPVVNVEGYNRYLDRFVAAFPAACLNGVRIGVYQHSSVARDCLTDIFNKLGASVTTLGRSEQFIAVDTEAIRPEDIELGHQWASEHQFDCIVSTDGDGDRPLISDEQGTWLRGDVAGILCAQYFNADIVVTPVSSNSAVDKSGSFSEVIRTRIGSPYVIAAMEQAQSGVNKVVGYEANGGFLQASVLTVGEQSLAPLPTRDAVIVLLAVIMLAKEKGCSIAELLRQLPSRFTYSDRLKNFPLALSQQRLQLMTQADLASNLAEFQRQFPQLDTPIAIDTTDGVRVTLNDGYIVHLRPSGNAPELRCYTEADSVTAATVLNQTVISAMKQWLD